jgi:hypothetical protein
MSRWKVQYCKITLASFHCRLWYSFFSFQSAKLNTTYTEAAHFIKDIIVKELLSEESAELSELHKTEVFDSCEVCKEVFSRTSYISGHTSARGRQTVTRCETCVTSSTHKRSAIEGMRGRVRRFLCDVCKRRFTSRSNLESHTRFGYDKMIVIVTEFNWIFSIISLFRCLIRLFIKCLTFASVGVGMFLIWLAAIIRCNAISPS